MTATTTQWEAVWEGARASAHTIVIGEALAPLTPGDLQMLWVGCDAGSSAKDPLGEALRRIETLLGEDASSPAQVCASRGAGLPEQLFDDLPPQSMEVRFVEACNRLAGWTGCNVVVGFQALDAADEATITMLMQILRHPGCLRLPVILTIQRVTPGPISELIDVLRHAAGETAVEEGVAPGGGLAYILALPAMEQLQLAGERQVGVAIVRRAMEESMRQMALNAGAEGATNFTAVQGRA